MECRRGRLGFERRAWFAFEIGCAELDDLESKRFVAFELHEVRYLSIYADFEK